jgi:hypothetical protein
VTRRHAIALAASTAALLAGVPAFWSLHTSLRFPSDRSPEGAYLRIVLALGSARLRDCFAFLETAAQHALYSIHDFRKRSLALVRAWFEEPERARLLEAYGAEGDAPDPPELWAVLARQRGWDARLRRDLSGIRSVERAGDRATVQTVQGTRYAFRRADNGIFGLTMFTAELLPLRDRAARDFGVVERAAKDYEHARRPG